jgi:membrane complex biogenesis BtpA family protein
MVHLEPLPGTPFHEPGSFERLLATAVSSACALARGGAHGCLVQTVDRVYEAHDESDPARTAAMGIIVHAVKQATPHSFTVGVQMMRNAIVPSLGVAKVTGAQFIRATALVGSSHSDGGTLRGDPYAAMDYRKRIDAGDVLVIADIATLHHRPSEEVGELARRAARAGAGAVAVGNPDERRSLEWIASVRRSAPQVQVFLSGHTNHNNAARLLLHADGAFVGTCFEKGAWGGVIDEESVAEYIRIIRTLPDAREAPSNP